MKEFDYVIEIENGLHARPAGMLSTVAKTFESNVKVRANGKEADGKRLLSLMALGAKRGTSLHFEISGTDEAAAEKALMKHCQEKLNNE